MPGTDNLGSLGSCPCISKHREVALQILWYSADKSRGNSATLNWWMQEQAWLRWWCILTPKFWRLYARVRTIGDAVYYDSLHGTLMTQGSVSLSIQLRGAKEL